MVTDTSEEPIDPDPHPHVPWPLISKVEDFQHQVAQYAIRTGVNVLRLIFTCPRWVRPALYVTHGLELADAVAGATGEGIWLLADINEEGKFQWDAIAASARDTRWFETQWKGLTGVPLRPRAVHYVRACAAGSTEFDLILTRSLSHFTNQLPPQLRHRVITSGPLSRTWRRSVGAFGDSIYLDNWIIGHVHHPLRGSCGG